LPKAKTAGATPNPALEEGIGLMLSFDLPPPAFVLFIADTKQNLLVAKIGALPCMPAPAVYRRANGETFLKLNNTSHVKVIFRADGAVMGAGDAEDFDPEEIVIVLRVMAPPSS
jgi:hypothetical protein